MSEFTTAVIGGHNILQNVAEGGQVASLPSSTPSQHVPSGALTTLLDPSAATPHQAAPLPGDDHPNILIMLSNLASSLHDNGEYDRALPLYEECLSNRKRILGDDHPDTLTSLSNLASVLHDKGEYERALPLFEECLSKSKRVLGDDHPDTLISLNNIALLFDNKGEYDRALPLYEECLAKSKRVLGDDHPDTLRSLNNLAALFKKKGSLSVPAAAAAPHQAIRSVSDVSGGDTVVLQNLIGNLRVFDGSLAFVKRKTSQLEVEVISPPEAVLFSQRKSISIEPYNALLKQRSAATHASFQDGAAASCAAAGSQAVPCKPPDEMSELFARLRGKAADHTITTVLGTVVSFYLSESPPVAVKEITVLAIKSDTMMNDTAIQYVTSHQHEDPNVSGVIAWEKSPWNVQEQQYVDPFLLQ
jgi:tetratricopeptide (TPR) repeat protein